MDDKLKKYPEGQLVGMWMAIGIAIFSGLGIPISIVTNNFGFIAIGPALGVSFGLAIGQSIENRYKKEGRLRPLTESEQKRKKNSVIAGIVILTIGFLMAILILIV